MKTLKLGLMGALGLGAAVLCTPSLVGADQSPPKPPTGQGQGGGARPPGGPQRQQEFMKKMVEELKLTPEQKKKIEDNQKAQAEKMAKLRQDTSLSQEDRRAKTRAIREENDKKMKEILNAEQFEKWQKMRQEQRQNAYQGGGGGQRGGGQRGGGQPGTGTAK